MTDQANSALPNDYPIIKELGRGGMGKVYLAKDNKLQRDVALKKLHKECSPSNIIHEARLLAKINHPNVVQVHNILEEESNVSIVMEYVEGITLDKVIKERHISLEQKLQWLYQLSLGLSAAHSQDVIHCDLKPSNILVDYNNQIKIADFGIAQLIRADESADSNYGSLAYMAPEVIMENNHTKASDLFSFGVIAFQLLTGQHPFGNLSPQKTSERILNNEKIEPNHLTEEMPKPLILLIVQLLSHKKEQRPQSAQVVSDSLKQLLVLEQQREILSQETQPFTKPVNDLSDKSHIKNRVIKILSIILVALAALIITFSFFLQPQDSSRNLVILPPHVTNTDDSYPEQNYLVRSTIDSALRNYAINALQLDLVGYDESNSAGSGLPTVAKATGASDILTTRVDCHGVQCDVVFSRADNNGKVISQIDWMMPFQNISDIYLISQQKISTLFPEISNTIARTGMNDPKNYESYIQLYQSVRIDGSYNQETLKHLSSLIDKEPHFYPAYTLYRELALNLYEQTQEESYLENLEFILTNSPSSYRLSHHGATNYFWLAVSRNQYKQAERWITRVKQQGASELRTRELESYLYFSTSQYSKAIESYQKALQLRTSTLMLYNLSLTYWFSGDILLAKNNLMKILKLTPEDYFSNQFLASIELFEGNTKKAIPLYKKLIEDNPQSIDLNNLSLAYLINGEALEALKFAQQAVKLNPNHSTWTLNLADVLWLNGQTTEARKYYQQVIKLRENSPDFKSLLETAQAYVHTKNPTAAVKALDEARQLSPDNGELFYTSALVLSVLQENTSATLQVERALEKGIGVRWFNLTWFDNLCSDTLFIDLMKQHNNAQRCII
ncbi:serine/threonine-protein kinase [Pleionea sp. CnH1-48]|uniref:serine/threonine-protein kinase n=1 Tax=Pleionea sp. CnH1-48 TaxID=2954494 RepID=UPI00209811D5|nr:serine/threonine-protein kinase [Pleionea sp. CnH1-48]MCO7226327.1 protein kinase [Pleionea sp. CnH1-48]